MKDASIALLIENQKLMNENATSEIPFDRSKLVDLTFKIYTNTNLWNWISIQPMTGPTSIAYYPVPKEKDGVPYVSIEDTPVVALTRWVKINVAPDFSVEDRYPDFINEIETEVLTDLWNNTGSVGCVNLTAHKECDHIRAIREQIFEIKHLVASKGQIPNYLVVNKELYGRYSSAFIDLGEGVTIYSHSGVPGVLWGYKGEGFDAGYTYCPFIPFTIVKTGETERIRFFTRYGKRLFVNGSSFYGRFKVLQE